MIPLKYLILFFLTVTVFVLALCKREKLAVCIMIFTVPYSATPFDDVHFFIGLNGFLVWSIWLALKYRECRGVKLVDWKVISPAIVLLYYFLFAGILLPIIKRNHSIDTFTEVSPELQVLNYSLYILTVILFIKILVNFRNDFEFQNKLIFVFLSTAFLQFFSYLLFFFGSQDIVPYFLVGHASEILEYNISEDPVIRFAGLASSCDFLIDYSMMLIGLGTILLINKRYVHISALAIIVSVTFGLATGTRSFVIVLCVFILMVILLSALRRVCHRFVIKAVLYFTVVLSTGAVIGIKYFDSTIIFARLMESYDAFIVQDYAGAVNRRPIAAIPNVVTHSGVLGNGSLFLAEINYEHPVSHNVYLAVYAKYGIVGLLSLVGLFYLVLRNLYRHIKAASNATITQEAIILFSLLVSLYLQEMKFSSIRKLTPILCWAFLFMVCYFHFCRAKSFGLQDAKSVIYERVRKQGFSRKRPWIEHSRSLTEKDSHTK